MGGNPFLWLQITDSKGKPLTSELFRGRCDQGTFTRTAALSLPVAVSGEVTASDCEATAGPVVAANAEARLEPLHGKLIFRSATTTGNRGGNPDAVLDLAILPSSQGFMFPSQPAQAGIGGDPLISVQLREGDGGELGPALRFGRCHAVAR